jgi:GMP synthase-like glutamine amidotransferase
LLNKNSKDIIAVMTKRALFILQDYVSDGGPVAVQFRNRGYEIQQCVVVDKENYKTPNVTVNWPNFLEFDAIVALGAPWGAFEDERIGNWLLPEMHKLQEAHNAGIPILGICFGGQLMARALGGTVARGPYPELGWHEIQSDDESFIPKGPWFQYHWDRFTLPPGAKEIARTELCPQAFTFGRTLGTQFHPDVDSEVLDLWLAMEGGPDDLEAEGVVIADLRAQTKLADAKANPRSHALVNYFLDNIATAPVQPI